MGVAYEYGAEMTYPLPEATSGGLINWVSQVSLYICSTHDRIWFICIIMSLFPFCYSIFLHNLLYSFVAISFYLALLLTFCFHSIFNRFFLS